MISVTVPIRTVSVMNAREHWAKKAKRAREHRDAAHWAMLPTRRPALPCTVTLTRIAPRALDGDNLQASMKALRDGIADWLKVDDRDPRVTWAYGQRRGEPKTYTVEVQIA